jgi:hypothetical protein
MYWLFGQKSKPSTTYSYIKQYSEQSGFTEYNPGARLPLPTEILECFQSKALRMISEGIYIHQQLKNKSAATALNTVLASAHTQTA